MRATWRSLEAGDVVLHPDAGPWLCVGRRASPHHGEISVVFHIPTGYLLEWDSTDTIKPPYELVPAGGPR